MTEAIPSGVGRLLTAILSDDEENIGKVREVLCDQFGLDSFVTHRCRGALPGCPVDRKGVPLWREMVIVEVLVPEEKAEAVFDAIHWSAIAGRSDGGMLLMGLARRHSVSG